MSSQELPPVQKIETVPPRVSNPREDETKQAVPSSDAILPSSPSPVKQVEATQESIDGKVTEDTKVTKDETRPEDSAPVNSALLALQTKLSTLQGKLTSLQQTQATHIQTHNSTLPSGLPIPSHWTTAQIHAHALESANGVIKEHISLLHGYNEIKDVGMGLLGMVAETRGVRQKEIMEEFGVGEKD